MRERKIPRGWIRTPSGLYQHLHTRVCSWLPPYGRPIEGSDDSHEVPAQFRRTLERDQKSVKRRRVSSEVVPHKSDPERKPAAEEASNWMPDSLAWTGLDVQTKTAVNLANELGPKVFRCNPEFVTTTQQDPVNPFLTTVVMEGIVIARGAFTNKKMSRQLAAREALRILCPLLRLGTDPAGFTHVDDENSVGQGGVLGAKRVTTADLEAKDVATLRLKLTDDKILDSTVAKTPVMVLQEHCHKHVGRVPTYTDVTETARGQRAPRKSVRSGPQSFTVKVTTCNMEETGIGITKKRARQHAALQMLRKLYPHVKLWGDVVESMNSRQREARVAGEAKRRRLCGPQAGASTIKEHSVPAQRMLEMVRVELWKRVSEQESPLLDTLPRKRAE
jgi:dsRNA-specific ribonuclease